MYRFSHSVLACPFTSSSFVALFIFLETLSDFGDERIIRVGVSEQGADGEEHLRDGQSG